MNNSPWESFMKFSHLTIATFSHIESCNSRICNSQKLAIKFEQIYILPISNPIVGCKILYLHDKEHFSCFKYSRLKEKALILHGDIRLYNYLINPPTPEKKKLADFRQEFFDIFLRFRNIAFLWLSVQLFYEQTVKIFNSAYIAKISWNSKPLGFLWYLLPFSKYKWFNFRFFLFLTVHLTVYKKFGTQNKIKWNFFFLPKAEPHIYTSFFAYLSSNRLKLTVHMWWGCKVWQNYYERIYKSMFCAWTLCSRKFCKLMLHFKMPQVNFL